MILATFENYGNYSSENYGVHTMKFTDANGAEYWYSYETLVAFKKPGEKIVVRENEWGTTTGKHLNWIDGGNKKERVNKDLFNQLYKEYFE